MGGTTEPEARTGRAIPLAGGLVAAVLAAVSTRHGLLYDPDSASYLRTADILRSHPLRVLSVPASDGVALSGHYPPGYPWLLGQFAHVGSLLTTGRWLGVACAFLTTWMLATMVGRHVRPLTTVGFLLALLVTRGYVGRLFGFVMADGVSITAVVAALFALDAALDTDAAHERRRMALVTAAALAAGFAALTRLADLAVVATALAAVALFASARRARLLAITAVLGLAAVGAWLLVQPTAAGPQRRAAGWYPPLRGDATDLLHTTALSWLPDQVVTGALSPIVSLAVGAGLLAALAWSVRCVVLAVRGRASIDRRDRLTSILIVFAWWHLLVVAASRLFLDPWIVFEARHLLPSLVAGLAVVALRWDGLEMHRGARAAGVGVVVAIVLIAAVPFARSVHDLSGSFENIERRSGSSPLTEEVRALPTSTPLYADRSDVVYLLTGRRAKTVPAYTDEKTGRVDPNFTREARSLARDVQRHHGVVVLYEDDAAPTSTRSELLARTGLVLAHTDADGSILRCPRSGACDRPRR